MLYAAALIPSRVPVEHLNPELALPYTAYKEKLMTKLADFGKIAHRSAEYDRLPHDQRRAYDRQQAQELHAVAEHVKAGDWPALEAMLADRRLTLTTRRQIERQLARATAQIKHNQPRRGT